MSGTTADRSADSRLPREEWDFSKLPPEETIPALVWEFRRETPDWEQVTQEAQAWVDGKLRDRKCPRRGSRLSEADKARIRAMAAFGHFLASGEFRWFHRQSFAERRKEHDRRLADQLSALLKNCHLPWLCLPAAERRRITTIVKNQRSNDVVRIGAWWDALAHFKEQKPDAGLPLKFDCYEHTSVLLTLDWRHGRKRILAGIAQLLKQLEPAGIKRWDRRGRKNRDLLVRLERLAMMRVLHHYTLSEVKRLLPDAWHLYQNRKWYDERRRCVTDFRSVNGFVEPEKWFPRSWITKAQRTTRSCPLPGK